MLFDQIPESDVILSNEHRVSVIYIWRISRFGYGFREKGGADRCEMVAAFCV